MIAKIDWLIKDTLNSNDSPKTKILLAITIAESPGSVNVIAGGLKPAFQQGPIRRRYIK